MRIKLSRFCEGIMEAAWLAAIILVPVYFNIYSSRIFEPDKISLLRSIALLILGAWLVKLIDEGGFHWDRIRPEGSRIKFITKFPLALPVIATVVLYLISTVFSVVPRTSFWGSYQRLQGTYTTFSYLVIFLAILGNVRRRAQVERIITTIILASLPIALYGILQRYKIDPVPWAGDTSIRISANMGNSIFVAAYLIMVFPLTIGRIVQSFGAILREEQGLWSQVARATIYVFTASVEVIALYMSGSRGPALGWLSGSFFLFLLLSLYWRKRGITIATIAIAFAVGIFLIIFNIKGGPLEGLRKSPAIGRFGSLLDAESNSALVRKYIWQGAAELVKPHAPLEYPDGRQDIFNVLRPLIGYGPESMYVAYNPFYVPELAIVEKRNASPDRSHNETWDALVITGVLGILVYLMLFTLIFYYGLKWIGLVTSHQQRNMFLGLWLGLGLTGAVGLSVWRGVAYFGVGFPLGMLVGLLVYLTIVAVLGKYRAPENESEAARSLTLIILIAAIVSHFLEINFGIAIVSTRTYFWVYAGLIIVVGYILPRIGVYELSEEISSQSSEEIESDQKRMGASTLKKKRRGRNDLPSRGSKWLEKYREPLISTLIITIVLCTLVFDFISNPRGVKTSTGIIWGSITQLPNQNYAVSFGILSMILTSWVFMAIVWVAEQPENQLVPWWKGLLITLVFSLAIGGIYGFWHADSLAAMARNSATTMQGVMDQVGRFERLISLFYFVVIVLILGLGVVLSTTGNDHIEKTKPMSAIAVPVILLAVLFASFYSNVHVIQADVVFKIADPFTRGGQWPAAITIYNRANELAPNEDYYYLFLGRAYLEYAKTLQDANERDRLIQEAQSELLKAQSLNPLNTDHTANLARLYSMWASSASDAKISQQRGMVSSDYFSKAVTLSRNSAVLWDEWAYLQLSILKKPEDAYQKLSRALEIDPEYHRTYALLGEYYLQEASGMSEASSKQEAYQEAIANYEKAMQLPAPQEPIAKFTYAQVLGSIYAQVGQLPAAIDAYQRAIDSAPTGVQIWRIHEAIAGLYAQSGDVANALLNIQYALNEAPEDQKDRLRGIVSQLQQASQP